MRWGYFYVKIYSLIKQAWEDNLMTNEIILAGEEGPHVGLVGGVWLRHGDLLVRRRAVRRLPFRAARSADRIPGTGCRE